MDGYGHSLFSPWGSLHPANKFPVLVTREFGFKGPKSLGSRAV